MNVPSDFSFPTYILELGQGHMLGAASLTFFLYDILLTFDQEVILIHQGAGWGLPKVLYLLNRYFVLIIMIINTLVIFLPAPSDQFCTFATRFSGLGGVFAKFILDAWLILRVYAIWGCSQRVLIILGTFFFANVCVSCIVAGFSVNELQSTNAIPRLPGLLMTGCIVQSPLTNFWVVFVMSLFFEVVIFLFTIWKAVSHWKSGFRRGDTPLFAHLYQTGIIYFAVMALTMAFMSVTALTPLQDVVLPGQLLSAFVSTVCARMMLGIRAVMKGEIHFSNLRPSDIHISNFRLTPLPIHSTHAHGQDERPGGEYINIPSPLDEEAQGSARPRRQSDLERMEIENIPLKQ